MILQEIIGLIMAGILSILWWDLRGFRKEAAGVREEAAGVREQMQSYRLEIQKEREEFRQEINGKYLTEKTHGLICAKERAELLNKMAEVVEIAVRKANNP
jgi:hypothetical protein